MVRLIRAYLNAGITDGGVVVERSLGEPQGVPLSPLPANVLLDEVDRALEARGHSFARYADDCNVYVRSMQAGQRVMAWLTKLYGDLRLQINEAKSAVASAFRRKFLGNELRVDPGQEVKCAVAQKALDDFKARIRQLTRRSGGRSMEQVVDKLGVRRSDGPMPMQEPRGKCRCECNRKPSPIDPVNVTPLSYDGNNICIWRVMLGFRYRACRAVYAGWTAPQAASRDGVQKLGELRVQSVSRCHRPYGPAAASEAPGFRRVMLGGALLFLFDRIVAQPAPAGGLQTRGEVDFGIVVNQTITAAGQEFYRRFTDFWREKPDFESYTLVVFERLGSRFGSRVAVSYGQTVVFTGALPVKVDAIRTLGAEAAEKAYAGVVAAGLRVDGAPDPDMGPNEF